MKCMQTLSDPSPHRPQNSFSCILLDPVDLRRREREKDREREREREREIREGNDRLRAASGGTSAIIDNSPVSFSTSSSPSSAASSSFGSSPSTLPSPSSISSGSAGSSSSSSSSTMPFRSNSVMFDQIITASNKYSHSSTSIFRFFLADCCFLLILLSFILLSSFSRFRLCFWEPRIASKTRLTRSHQYPICAALFNRSFGQVVSADEGAVVCVWDLETGQLAFRFQDGIDDEIKEARLLFCRLLRTTVSDSLFVAFLCCFCSKGSRALLPCASTAKSASSSVVCDFSVAPHVRLPLEVIYTFLAPFCFFVCLRLSRWYGLKLFNFSNGKTLTTCINPQADKERSEVTAVVYVQEVRQRQRQRQWFFVLLSLYFFHHWILSGCVCV